MRDHALTTGIAGPNESYLADRLLENDPKPRQPDSQTSPHGFRWAAENAGGLWKSVADLGTVVDFGRARSRKGYYSSRSADWRRTWLFPHAISCLAGGVDFVTVLATGLLAYFTRFGIEDTSALTAYSLLLAALMSVNIFQIAGLYSLDALSGLARRDHRLPVSWGLAALILLAVGFATHTLNATSRIWVGIWFIYGLAGLMLVRLSLRYQIRRWRTAGHLARNVVIVGGGDRVRRLVEHLGGPEAAAQGLRLLGHFSDGESRIAEGVAECPMLGKIDDLWRFSRCWRIDEVIIALPWCEEERISRLVESLSMLPLTARLCPDWIGLQVLHREVVQLSGVPLLTLAEQPLSGWMLLLKDFVDRVLAFVMAVTAMPLLVVIAVAILLDSPGSVLYRQKRYGFNREIIEVFKFRTMYADRCDHDVGAPLVQATRNDPRVTRVGALLRRTSLDELPQLFNVLKGDMSIVGPRPHAVVHNEYYGKLIDAYLARHKVKPGITGWAQVNGLRGETDTLDKMEKRIQYDLFYIKNWSLRLDLEIILRTLLVGFTSHVAY